MHRRSSKGEPLGKKSRIRLFVDLPLANGQAVPLSQSQVHYLATVMRRAEGDPVWLFNGSDGEWQAELADLGKKKGFALPSAQSRAQSPEPDLWLVFAPVKRNRTEWIVEKATEMGVNVIQPVSTAWSQSDKLRLDRLQSIAIEAAEQSERLSIPEIRPVRSLASVLTGWDSARSLVFADERGADTAPLAITLPAAVLIGPEGGFSPEERSKVLDHPSCAPLSLGPRILRADTAVVAALTVVQSRGGDWT